MSHLALRYLGTSWGEQTSGCLQTKDGNIGCPGFGPRCLCLPRGRWALSRVQTGFQEPQVPGWEQTLLRKAHTHTHINMVACWGPQGEELGEAQEGPDWSCSGWGREGPWGTGAYQGSQRRAGRSSHTKMPLGGGGGSLPGFPKATCPGALWGHTEEFLRMNGATQCVLTSFKDGPLTHTFGPGDGLGLGDIFTGPVMRNSRWT